MQDSDFEALGCYKEMLGPGMVGWQRGDGSALHVVITGAGANEFNLPLPDGPFTVALYNCDEWLGGLEIDSGKSAGTMLRAFLSGMQAEYGV